MAFDTIKIVNARTIIDMLITFANLMLINSGDYVQETGVLIMERLFYPGIK